MTDNPYPLQIKRRVLFNLASGFVCIVALFLIIAIFSSILMAISTTIVLGVLVVLGILWNLLYLNSIEYSFDNKNLTFRGGVISRFEKVIPYSKIQHIITYESFWQRFLGLSSVSIETARESGFASATYGEGPFIPDLNVEDAEKLKNHIISVSNIKYKPVAGV